MKKNLQDRYQAGQEIAVDMLKPQEETKKFPIARNKEGVVCFIARHAKGFFEYNSTWIVKVIEVRANVLIIEPVECLMSAAANAFEMSKKLEILKTKKF